MPVIRRNPLYAPIGTPEADLGVDLSAIPDLDPTFSLQRGNAVLGEALLRRFSTPKRSLSEDPSYGSDLRAMINMSLTERKLFEIKNTLEREAEADPRVSTAVASINWDQRTEVLTAGLEVSTSEGPFQFVFAISAATAELLGIA